MSIMTFGDYEDFLDDAKFKMESLDRQISYRKIQLVGRNEYSNSYLMKRTEPYNSEEDAILKNDEVLNSLHVQKEQLRIKIDYVTKWGKLPLEKCETISRICDNQNKED